MLNRIDEIRARCPECRTPSQSGTRNGYTCPDHWPLFHNGDAMPSVGDIPEIPESWVGTWLVIAREIPEAEERPPSISW